ncbi:MAG: undecaprenyl-diphosphate phosphatase [Oscillospiraceae bacterium]|nr:undecaprenyl-diphosphate phosphatase [Oscillospiraceae bacterium]
MTISSAIIQGIIQGLTEFLPISSSGHLALYQHFTNKNIDNGLLFSVILHLGTLAAIFVVFRKTISELFIEFFKAIGDIFTGNFKKNLEKPSRRLLVMLFIACLPLFFIYIFRDFYESLAGNPNLIFEGFCFLLTALLLFLADRCVKGKKNESNMKYKDSIAVGLVQAVLAPLPGVSRSGSTISTGLLSGFSKEFAVKFSFILGIPTILGGCVFEISAAIDELKTTNLAPIIIGFFVSALVGYLSMKLVNWIVKTDKFKIFEIYTVILGVAVILIGLYERFFV